MAVRIAAQCLRPAMAPDGPQTVILWETAELFVTSPLGIALWAPMSDLPAEF